MKPWGLFGIWISEAFALALLSGCAGPRTLGPATAPAGEARAPGARMEDAPATLSLEALFRLAESRNPSLRAAAAAAEAARGRMREAGLYPNPRLSAEAGDLPADPFDTAMMKTTLAIEQPLILGGRRRAAQGGARAEWRAQEAARRALRHEILMQVQELYLEALYLGEAMDLQLELVALAERTAERIRERARGGGAPAPDMQKAEYEAERLRLDYLKLVTRRSTVRAELEALLGGAPAPLDRLAGALQGGVRWETLASREEEAVAAHPALEAARERVEAARWRLERARAERIPDLGLRAGAAYDSREDEALLLGGLAIELPVFDRNQGAIEEAKALLAAAGAERDATRDRLAAQYQSLQLLVSELDTVAADSRERLVPLAGKAYEGAMEALEAGRESALGALDALRTLAEARQAELRYRYELNQRAAELRHFLREPGENVEAATAAAAARPGAPGQ